MNKPKKKPGAPVNKCNICGHPSIIEYTDLDKETGLRVTKKHEVQCVGHIGIHPSMWNKHPDYDSYRKFAVRQQKITGAGNAKSS